MIENLRNIAIIAHVDHGKTTLVDQLLRQSGTLGDRAVISERMMDSNDLEKERGITIMAKNTAVAWRDYRINIVDTPGHADFGGEVERVLSMVDCVLLLVDAVDGPMPQTRFVTQKALSHGFRPIVVVNKIDRPGARPDWAVEQTFDLFDRLGATNEQLDFPVVFASALQGYAGLNHEVRDGDMTPLFEMIVNHVSPPDVDLVGSLQLQVSNLDYSSYVGLIGIGRIKRGTVKRNMSIVVVGSKGTKRNARVMQIFTFRGLEKVEVQEANAGDIIAFTGIDGLHISDTLCHPDNPEPLPALVVDEPTVSMMFQVNNSPFSGRDGKFVTSRQINERLKKELEYNVALRVEDTADPEKFKVSGRGELHLGILIENMRREGYELAVGRPHVVTKEVDGVAQEPYEAVTIDVEEDYQGVVMEKIGERGGELKDMVPDGKGRVRLDYIVPARGLIGFRNEFLTSTSGTGLIYHIFDHYGPRFKGNIGQRQNGALIANGQGKVLAYALFTLQERGRLFIQPGDEVYEGMVVGLHSRENDLVVNPLRAKQLTNIRAAGKDDNLMLTPPVRMTLEQALEFINDDELVEVTPTFVRIRKKALNESDRKRNKRTGENDG